MANVLVDLADKKQEVVSDAFAAPWKNSDVILVAGDVEFHVHRAILCFQSPVFEAMLNGDFKEGKQDKVTLEGKNPLEICDFFKLLYPSKAFESPLNEENVATILGLADEYQADAVLKHCFAETTITANNALIILPYASKYDQTRYLECINVAMKLIKCENLKESIPDLEPSVREEILVGKCELLEDALMRTRDNLIACMDKLSIKPKESRYATKAVCCFAHEVRVNELHKAKQCKGCLLAYKDKFCDIVPAFTSYYTSINGQKNKKLLELLENIDDLLSQRDD